MAKRSMFVGMDVHKESIDVSLAEEGRDGEVRHYGVIPGDLEAVAKVVRALRAPTPTVALRVRGRPVRVWDPPLSHRPGGRLRRRQSLEHAETERRSDQDRSAGWRRLGPVASRRRAHGDLHSDARG